MTIAISLIISSMTIGLLLAYSPTNQEKRHLFTYPLSAGNKTHMVTVETNWTEERAPSVSLLNSTVIGQSLELYFLGGKQEKTVYYNITIPTNLLWGNITLTRKYYTVDIKDYILVNNGTHNSLQMTFDYKPFFSGNGYFVITGTEGTQ